MYDKLGELDAKQFGAFVDRNNHSGRLVIMHMLVVDFIMSRRLPSDGSKVAHYIGLHRGFDLRKAMSVEWIEEIMESLPEEYVGYGEWGLEFVRTYMYTCREDGLVWMPLGSIDEGVLNLALIKSRPDVEADIYG